MPPLFLVWGRGDQNTFTDRDRLLMVALQMFEQTVDSETGMSALFTTYNDYEGFFQMVRQSDDLARAAADRWRKDRDDRKQELAPGERWSVEFAGKVVDGEIRFPRKHD